MSDSRTFLEEVVAQTAFDWCDASYIYGLALDEVPAGEAARDLALDTIREGLEKGLVAAGDLVPTGGEPALEFRPWPLPAAEAFARIREEWLEQGTAPEPDTIVWLQATAAGSRLAEELEGGTS